MSNFDWEKTAASLTDVQFELLVRARLRMEAARASSINRRVNFRLSYSVPHPGSDTEIKLQWAVCFDYGDDTKGERVHAAMTEAMRRAGWEASSEATMMLIEGGS